MDSAEIVATEETTQGNIPQYILYHSIVAGLTPLVPIPFLDDWLKAQVHRRLLGQVLKKHGVEAKSNIPRILEDGPFNVTGCILSILLLPLVLIKMLVVKVIFKLIKKITIIFTINDCCNVTSEVFHSAYLLDYTLSEWDGKMSEEQAAEIHERIVSTLKAVDTRIFVRQIKGAFSERRALARRARISMRLLARRMWRNRKLTKPAPIEIDDDAGVFKKLIDSLSGSLSKMDDYFDSVKAEYDKQVNTQD